MSSTIQIKFLTLDEMANAKDIDYRYEHVGIDNLGFADKAKNRVFVRAGLEPQLQTLLIDHELSHLFELEGTDEDEFGIRHKKKGGFMRIFLPIALAIGGALLGGPAGAGIFGSLGGALGGGAGAALSGAGSALGTGIGTTLGGVAGSSLTGKPNWKENAISGAAAGATAGAGKYLSGFGDVSGVRQGLGTPITVTGARNTGGLMSGIMAGAANSPIMSSMFSQGAGQVVGSGLSGLASSGQGFNSGITSGYSDNASVPEMPSSYGSQGYESLTNSRGMGGVSTPATQVGTAQGGIGLAGKDLGGGFGNKQMADIGMNQMDQMFSDPFANAGMMF